jgi:hypothetical protein
VQWARASEFKCAFRGRVPGLGLAAFNALRIRLGFSTSKPDVWLHRFFRRCLRRSVTDTEIVDALDRAATQLGTTADDLDRRIWESERERGTRRRQR